MTSMENKSGYKKTKLGWIPEDWEVSTVENAFEICNSGRKPISQEVRKTMQGIYPYYGPTKIQDYINEFQYDGRYALIAEDGDHFLKYSEKPMTQIAEGQFNVNNHAHAVMGKKDITITDWFFWFFMNRNIYSHLTRQGAGRYKLNKKSLQQLKVVVPPLPEQQKIATILSTWDKAIDKLSALIDAKEEQKKGLVKRLLTGKMRLKGCDVSAKMFTTKFGEYPNDWSYLKIADIATQVSTKNADGKDLPVLSCTKYYGLVDSLKYFGKQVFSKDTSTYKVVSKGQFAYATNHIEEGSIGYQNLYDKALISPMYTAFETKDEINDFFLYRLLKTPLYLHVYQANTSASVDRRGSLRWKAFSQIRVPMPPREEQDKIAHVIKSMEDNISVLNAKRDCLLLEKKGLMQQLLTGKRRVEIK